MTAPAVDDRIFGLRFFERRLDEQVAGVSFKADSGKLTVTVREGGKEAACVLDLGQLDSMLDGLPKLRDWVASGEPALYSR